MMGLDWKTFTALGVARLAAKHKVLPNEFRQQHWEGTGLPPYAVGSGDIGYVTKQNHMDVWNPLKLGQASDVGQWSCGCRCGHAEGRWTYVEGGQWTSIALHECESSLLQWNQAESIKVSYEWAKRIRASLRSDGIQVKETRY
ncbi:hypothetical protein FRC09_016294, partial [Ceratobasidium sp. 395]